MATKSKKHNILVLPVIPMRDSVVFPELIMPLFVGREKSLNALKFGISNSDRRIFLVAQKNADILDPLQNDLYQVGCICNISQVVNSADGSMKVLLSAEEIGRVVDFVSHDEFLYAQVEKLSIEILDPPSAKAILSILKERVEELIGLREGTMPDVLSMYQEEEDPIKYANLLAGNVNISFKDRQDLLQTLVLERKLNKLDNIIIEEIQVIEQKNLIRKRVEEQVAKFQKEYLLNEQLKAIKKELGEDENKSSDLVDLQKRISENKNDYPSYLQDKLDQEINKLSMLPQYSSEYSVIRSYVELLLDLPWKKEKYQPISLKKAIGILDTDHYGMEKVKDRVLENLAVQEKTQGLKGPIICLLGPPGVGKTSLAKSIAKALGREFGRISLGGIHDESEIRGHRRTYIGSMPGKVIQLIRKLKTNAPVILLDEIDKIISYPNRSDPSAALLELLDPSQNESFLDNYVEIGYDLSKVMFIATANQISTIATPLLDRLEVIELSGYTDYEKKQIALKHLLPKQLVKNGLNSSEVEIDELIIDDIINYYTREAGVRNLDRKINSITRKVVRQIIEKKNELEEIKEDEVESNNEQQEVPIKKTKSKKKKVNIKKIIITQKNAEDYLGPKKYIYDDLNKEDRIGSVNGLVYNGVGGDVLLIEATQYQGEGKIILTGKLGDVLKESVQIALSLVKTNADEIGFDINSIMKQDIHVHFPDGATPKDGPSAGIAISCVIASLFTNKYISKDIAMTGEVTLQGKVLPIGGLKEKLLAALRKKIKIVILPEQNKPDLIEIPSYIKDYLTIYFVNDIKEVFEIIFKSIK